MSRCSARRRCWRRGAAAAACPAPMPLRMRAPPGSPQPAGAIEIARTAGGTLALRGRMVPRHPFPPGAERLGEPEWRANATGFIDTGYACRQPREGAHVLVTAPPPGVVSVGGYRFVLRETGRLGAPGVERCHHRGPARRAVRPSAGRRCRRHPRRPGELLAFGAHALVTEAFRDRPRSGLSRTG